MGDAVVTGMGAALVLVNGFVAGVAFGWWLRRPSREDRTPKMQTFHVVEPSGGESVRKVPRKDESA